MLLARESEMAADDPGDTVSFATVQIKEEKKKLQFALAKDWPSQYIYQ